MQKQEDKKILSVRILHLPDENPDTSFIGKYVDEPRPDAIIVSTGEYCEKVDRRRRLLDALDDQIRTLEDEKDEPDEIISRLIDKCKARQKKIENSGATEYPSKGREWRFFLPYAGGEKWPSRDYKKYGLQDFERMEKLNKGYWYFMGIRAEARTWNPKNELTQKITSGGLYGIESDAGNDCFKEVEAEELSQLRGELELYGFTARQIAKAFKKVERQDK